MSKYEPGELVTYYFVIYSDDNKNIIQAWTDEKSLAKYYMEFHKCKKFKLIQKRDTIERITKYLEENVQDEIKLHNIVIKDSKHKNGYKYIVIPATETEFAFINEENNTFMSSRINYGYINTAIDYLKDKYVKALKDILLVDIICAVVHNKYSSAVENITFDQLMILFESFPDKFGR